MHSSSACDLVTKLVELGFTSSAETFTFANDIYGLVPRKAICISVGLLAFSCLLYSLADKFGCPPLNILCHVFQNDQSPSTVTQAGMAGVNSTNLQAGLSKGDGDKVANIGEKGLYADRNSDMQDVSFVAERNTEKKKNGSGNHRFFKRVTRRSGSAKLGDEKLNQDREDVLTGRSGRSMSRKGKRR